VPTSCQPAGSNDLRWQATILEISQSGLRLRLRRRFEPRAGLAIEMPGKPGSDSYTVYTRVIHVRNEGNGYYLLGCKFMSPLSEEELHRLVHFGEPPQSAKPTIIDEVRVCISVQPGRYVRCRVKRFRVAGAWPMTPGQTIDLQGISRDGSQLAQSFRVVSCNEDRNGWTLHVRPLLHSTPPPWLEERAWREQGQQ
jgi:hypothetical protein